jgi:signal peptidase II
MIYVLLSAAIIAADQLLKQWILGRVPVGGELALLPGLIRITNVHNTGAAFSLFQGMQTVILAVTGLFCLIVIFGLIMKSVKGVFGNLTLAMILGGALGNFIDRILSGYVVDMFDFEFMEFAVFNIADIFITVGAFMFCVYILIAGKKDNVFAFATHKKHRFADQEPAQEFHDYSLDKILEEYSEPAKPDTGSRVGTPFSDDTGNAD